MITNPSRVEVLCSLSLATDLGTGQPLEHGLATSATATALGRAAGLDSSDLVDAATLALLHSIGCTADAYEAAHLFGDDIAIRAAYSTIDEGNPREMLGFLLAHVGAGRPPLQRASVLAAAIAAGPKGASSGFAAHCQVGQRLAARLGLSESVREALAFVFERWDGKGQPNRVKGEAIPLIARILHVARDGVVLARRDGPDAAQALLVSRAGSAYDPRLAGLVSREVLGAGTDATWDDVLGLDPAARQSLNDEELEEACSALADFADVKSPSLLGHAHRSAELAEAAAWRLSLGEEAVAQVRCAALLADLGRVAVSNRIWDKPGPLSQGEWERVRLHPYYTERALSRSPALAALGEIAAAHHERAGGAGYHRRADAAQLPLPARILQAADCYAAMTEDRPHRPALDPAAAAEELRSAPLDAEAVDAVLAAAGHVACKPRHELPAGLSEREAQVLALIARGEQNKAVAARLGISVKTVGHHVQHIYAKIGVSTRAAAALFAVEHRLLDR